MLKHVLHFSTVHSKAQISKAHSGRSLGGGAARDEATTAGQLIAEPSDAAQKHLQFPLLRVHIYIYIMKYCFSIIELYLNAMEI